MRTHDPAELAQTLFEEAGDAHALVRRATIEPVIGIAGGDLDLFRHAFANQQVVALPHVLGNVHVHLIAGDAD